ncbi:MAG: hypothetical protein ACRDKS_06625 [Actinomycetota bacterium]
MFVIAVTALIGLIGAVLWYTNWAEARLIDTEPDRTTAEVR